MTTIRTDVHRPSAIAPEDYDFVSFDYIGPDAWQMAGFLQVERERFRSHREQTGGTYAKHENNGSCHVCGAAAMYLVRWHHRSSNTYIETGEDCARKMELSFGNMNAFRRNVADAREAQAGKRKAIAILADNNLMQTWEVFESSVFGYEENTIRDIVGKLVRYGSISEKQFEFVRKLLAKINDRPRILAEREAEKAAAGPVPVGRQKLSGVVLGEKEVDNPGARYSYYASATITKLLIRLDNGSKVFGPRFNNHKKGDRVEFVATVEASKDDAKFGFYSRAALPARELSKEEKKAIAKLRRIQKHLPIGTYEAGAIDANWQGAIAVGNLIDEIKNGKFSQKEAA